MVHYNPSVYAAQTLPPVCPKCGSHRTVIVGRSDDGGTIVLRCNTCGERSEIPMDHYSISNEAASSLPSEIRRLVRDDAA